MFFGLSTPTTSLLSIWVLSARLSFVGEEVLISRVARGLVGDVGLGVDMIVVVGRCGEVRWWGGCR